MKQSKLYRRFIPPLTAGTCCKGFLFGGIVAESPNSTGFEVAKHFQKKHKLGIAPITFPLLFPIPYFIMDMEVLICLLLQHGGIILCFLLSAT